MCDGFVVSDTSSEIAESESENETNFERRIERNLKGGENQEIAERIEKDELDELVKEANEFIGVCFSFHSIFFSE